jgi:tetratricopeptide (TPR) repeat protein
MALLPADDPRAISALPSLEQALFYGGRIEEALRYLEDAIVRATNAGADAIVARLAIERALLRTHVGPEFSMRESLAEIELLMTPLLAAGDDLGLAEGWSNVGVFRFWLGDGAGSLEALERARAHAERAGSDRLIRRISNELLGPFVWGPVPSPEVERRAGELIEQMGTAGKDSIELNESLAFAFAMQGKADLADERFQHSWTRARELGERLHLAATHPYLEATMMLGRYAETERVASQGIAELREMGETGYLATSLAYLAAAIVALGRPDEAQGVLQQVETLAADDDVVIQVGIRRIRAEILHAQGRHSEAEPYAREAIARGEPTDYLLENGSSHRVLAEILLAKGAQEEGLTHLRAALDLFERKGVLVVLDGLRTRIAEVEAR